MFFTQSHDENFPDKGFLQVVNSATAVADSIARGNLCIWDAAAPAAKKGIYIIVHPTASANDQRICGVAEDVFTVPAAGVADLTRVGLVQNFGLHDAITFTGTAASASAQGKLVPSATKATAAMITVTTPTVQQLAALIGVSLTTSGTPATVVGDIQLT